MTLPLFLCTLCVPVSPVPSGEHHVGSDAPISTSVRATCLLSASGDLYAYSEGIDVLHNAVLTKDKRLVVAAMLLNNTFCCCYQALTKFTIKFSFTHTIILCSYSLSVPKSLYQIFEVAYWVSSEQ